MNNNIIKYLNSYKRIEGKTYIVTGANSGLGFSVTKHLISLGARVIMACRNLDKAHKAKDTLLQMYPHSNLLILPFDQADFKSIDEFVNEISMNYSDFFGIVLNAGIFHPKKGLLTKDGYPVTIGTNYVGVYYLLKKLQEQQLFNQPIDRRIVFIGSLSWSKVNHSKIENILTDNTSSSIKEYAQSKTLLGSLAYQLSRHNKDGFYIPENVRVLLMHPGVTSTNIVSSKESSYPKWFSSLARKALSICVHSSDKASLGVIMLLLSKEVNEDKMIVPRGLLHISGYPKETKYSKKLRSIDHRLINISNRLIFINE